MLQDFSSDRELPEFDVCIAGAGPAGITLALKLGQAGVKVGLLEAGGMEFDQTSQDLYKIESVGRDLYASTTRLRYFGGTSNHWSGLCRPFVRGDFERKMIGDLPGWPISFDEMDRYLPEAMRILDLPKEGFTTKNGPLQGGNFDADESALSPPTRFAEKYLQTLRQSSDIHLVLNCNLVDIHHDKASGGVVGMEIAGYDKKRQMAKAKCYVVAMGAIENSRLLSNSESLMALQDFRKMVGVGFMEHLNVELGEFILKSEMEQTQWGFVTSQKMVEKKGIGRGGIALGVLQEIKSYGRTAKVKTFLKGLVCDLGMQDKIQFITHFNCPGQGVIGTLLEQFPQRAGNRVELSSETDYFGLKKVKLDWQLGEQDVKTIRVVATEMAKAFADSGLGFVKLRDYILSDDVFMPVSPHAHHMGGTRMAADSTGGLVDADCKVFGVDNLFVAGSSVFATGGGGNPTMPLIQLALRLADHLHAALGTQR